MCERIQKNYSIRVFEQYAYVTQDGRLQVGAVKADVWDIFPMPDNLRESYEREAAIGDDYSRRPYNATISGVLWTEGNSPSAPRVKIYFKDFNEEGLPNRINSMSIPDYINLNDLRIAAEVDLFGLAYQDRLFLCMLTVCTEEQEVSGNSYPSIRCRDYFVNEVQNGTHDQIAINRFCDKDDPNEICIDLCSKNRDTSEQCDSILYTRCRNREYAEQHPDVCGCYMPAQVYREYINKLRASISKLDDRYAAIKSLIQLVDYDPANPQCFYPACITAQYKSIRSNGTCPDFTVCLQGIDLSVGTIDDTQLSLVNQCLIDRNIGTVPPSNGPSVNPLPPIDGQPPTNRPPSSGPPSGGSKNKSSLTIWLLVGGGVLVLVVIIAVIAASAKKK